MCTDDDLYWKYNLGDNKGLHVLKKVNGEVKETFDHISYYSRNSAKPDVEFIEAKEEYREIKNKIDRLISKQ